MAMMAITQQHLTTTLKDIRPQKAENLHILLVNQRESAG